MSVVESIMENRWERHKGKQRQQNKVKRLLEQIRRAGTLVKPSGAKVQWLPFPELRALLYKMKKLERKLERLDAREEKNKAAVVEMVRRKHGPYAQVPEYTGMTLVRERILKAAEVTLKKIEKYRGMVEQMGGKIDMKEAA